MTFASVPAHSEQLGLAYVVARTLEVTVIAVRGIKVAPGAGRVSQEGTVLETDDEGFVEIDARVGSFSWTPV
jgi:hypothetical protein